LVSADKAVQKVYRDACLLPGRVTPQEMSLPDDTRDRITRIAVRRDRELLRAELDGLLGPPTLSESEAAAMVTACDGILDEGVRLARANGYEGMVAFVAKMDAWLQKCRRRGGGDFHRQVINYLAYEFKVAFYLCYANLWVTLIPWLKEHRGLDGVSERFLRLWHMQNQPVELPDGRYLPDVFCGQVLALHPLSGFVMKDPVLCAVAGRFFTSDAYDRVVALGRADSCAEYWEMVGALLTAAHLYRQAAREQEERRGRRDKQGGEDCAVVLSAEGLSPEGLLEELAARQGWCCASCGGELHFIRPQRAEGADTAELEFACRGCGTPARREVGHDELRNWLK
jgi:hypothetical protein